MPELIEVETYRRAAETAVGSKVLSVYAPDSWYLKRGTTAEALSDTLVGETVVAARRRGKLLLLDVGEATVGLHFGMTGRIIVDGAAPISELLYSSTRSETTYERFGITWSGGGLIISDPRRLGGVELAPDEDRLGPDALVLTRRQLAVVLSRTSRPLKAVLLDQSRIAGIGNLICDEVLWRAGIAPARIAKTLSEFEVALLSRRIKTTVMMLTNRGGSHTGALQDERNGEGHCPRDGAALRRDDVGGRTTYWCPEHQR